MKLADDCGPPLLGVHRMPTNHRDGDVLDLFVFRHGNRLATCNDLKHRTGSSQAFPVDSYWAKAESKRLATRQNSSPQPLLTLTSWMSAVGAKRIESLESSKLRPASMWEMKPSNSERASAALSHV